MTVCPIIVSGPNSVAAVWQINYRHTSLLLSHTPDKKRALREIVIPLLVGNVTTVGAFLALFSVTVGWH